MEHSLQKDPLGEKILNKKKIRVEFNKHMIIITQLRDTKKIILDVRCM
jgi:hypothetical protein